MKHLSLLISAALVAGTAVAQRNYVPGTVITHQSDSLKGFIDYQNWSISPGEIRFKKQLENAEEEHYKPADVNGFVISLPQEEEVYVSKQVLLDITRHTLSNLMETSARDLQDSVVFLSRLVKGYYTLYDYTDINSRVHYVYEKEGETPQELLMQKAYVTNSRGSGVFEDKAYQRQLEELFADNSGISRKGRSAAYEERPLKNIFIAYNSYKDPSFVAVEENKRTKYKVYFGVMAGISSSSYHPGGEASYFKNSKYDGSVSSIWGVWVDIPTGRNRRRFSIPIEAHYKGVKTNGKIDLYNGILTRFAFDYVQVNVMARYTYPKGFIRPYANIGMGNAFMIKIKQNEKSTNGGANWSEAIDGPRKHEQSIIAGIGATASRLGIECRYVGSTGFSPYGGSGIGVRSFQLIATCRL